MAGVVDGVTREPDMTIGVIKVLKNDNCFAREIVGRYSRPPLTFINAQEARDEGG